MGTRRRVVMRRGRVKCVGTRKIVFAPRYQRREREACQIFCIFDLQQLECVEIAPPGFQIDSVRFHRPRLQFHPRHLRRKFHQTARHVITRGNNDKSMKAMRLGPGSGLRRVAMRVCRRSAKIRAAIETWPATDNGLQFLFGGRWINSRYQKSPTEPALEQRNGCIQPRTAAGQRHNRIGMIKCLGSARQGFGERPEACAIDRRSGDGQKQKVLSSFQSGCRQNEALSPGSPFASLLDAILNRNPGSAFNRFRAGPPAPKVAL